MTEKDRKEIPYHYHARIRLYREEKFFGPGMAQLMQLVRTTGSLSAACKEMGMAYSKAWKMTKRAEEDLGFPLMEGSRGGGGGGSTMLTEEGAELLDRYLAFEAEAQEAIQTIFCKYFSPADRT